MRPMERGYVLLASHLGDPERMPLTRVQLGRLTVRMQEASAPDPGAELTAPYLIGIGLEWDLAERIVALLADDPLLDGYLTRAHRAGCFPVTRASPHYPARLRDRMGLQAPACLWVKGNYKLLNERTIAVVGSRELREENRRFAETAGYQIARQGYTLGSGNAKGADSVAQCACRAQSGHVVSIVADSLTDKPMEPDILYVSEKDFDAPFSARRALSRNPIIHALGEAVIAAQCTCGRGGTWEGSCANLRAGYSPLYCFNDGSDGARALMDMGAEGISASALECLPALIAPQHPQRLL